MAVKYPMDNYLKTNYDLNAKETVTVIDELPLWSAPFGLKLLEKIKYLKNITALILDRIRISTARNRNEAR